MNTENTGNYWDDFDEHNFIFNRLDNLGQESEVSEKRKASYKIDNEYSGYTKQIHCNEEKVHPQE